MGWWSQEAKEESDDLGKGLLEKLSPFLPEAVRDGAQDFLANTPWTSNHVLVLGVACTGSFLIGLKAGRIRPFWRPVRSLQDLSSADIGASAPWMKGTAITVSDGDTIKFLHQPTMFHSSSNYDKAHLLPIRLCTIDTPETAKFGKPGQALGEEAKAHLQGLCLNKKVKIKILQVDQYGRGVAEVVRPSLLWNTYLDEAMLKVGLAEVYQGSGAVYGRLGKEKYLQLAETAQSKKVGIWSDPKRESAAEYKRRTK